MPGEILIGKNCRCPAHGKAGFDIRSSPFKRANCHGQIRPEITRTSTRCQRREGLLHARDRGIPDSKLAPLAQAFSFVRILAYQPSQAKPLLVTFNIFAEIDGKWLCMSDVGAARFRNWLRTGRALF